MQGHKQFTPQLFYNLSLDELVPQDNFYRKLNAELDLNFLYKATRKYYGREGQESIDPRINARGMAQANKHVLMAAYNLKKCLKFTRNWPQSMADAMQVSKNKYVTYYPRFQPL